jgi:hypothetical protein
MHLVSLRKSGVTGAVGVALVLVNVWNIGSRRRPTSNVWRVLLFSLFYLQYFF